MMRRSNRVKWSEVRVGILIVFAFGVLLWASLTGGGTSIFETKRTFRAYFRNVNGLITGSPVWVSGVEVGNVRSVVFVNLDSVRRIEVVGSVKATVWPMITDDSYVRIGAIGLIGDKYVELVPGDAGRPGLADGGEVISREDDVNAIFSKANGAIDDMRELSKNLNDIMSKVNRGEGTLGRMFASDTLHNKFSELLSDLSRNFKKLEKNQDRAFASIEKSAKSFDRLASAMTDSAGTMGKLLYDSSLYVELSGTLGNLHRITNAIDSGNGSMGALVRDKDLYINTKDLLARLENLMKDIEKNPRKYLKFSVF